MNKSDMKKYFEIALLTLLASSFFGCKSSDIIVFDVDDSAVKFKTQSFQYSLKGMTEQTRDLSVPVILVGPTTDYDRPISVSVTTNDLAEPAVEGTDYTVLGGSIKAGELAGEFVLRVNKLSESSPKKELKISLQPNEYFRKGFINNTDSYSTATVAWSAEYVRPNDTYVWRCWFLYFSNYYSRAIHEVYVQVFGEDVEHYTRTSSVADGVEFIYKSPYWWYSASRTVRDYVRAHDAANPTEPLMHSDDCMQYSASATPVGAGVVPDPIPTIYETLIAL